MSHLVPFLARENQGEEKKREKKRKKKREMGKKVCFWYWNHV